MKKAKRGIPFGCGSGFVVCDLLIAVCVGCTVGFTMDLIMCFC